MLAQDRFTAQLRAVTQADMIAFGRLHGTSGRIHNDPDYARALGLGGTLVQGKLILAGVQNVCRALLGDNDFARCAIDAKFVGHTHPGDAIDVQFEVQQAAPLSMTYACTLADGKVVQVGTVSLPTS